jgi:hypothetical protein
MNATAAEEPEIGRDKSTVGGSPNIAGVKTDISGARKDLPPLRIEVPGVITRRRGCVPLRVRISSSSDIDFDPRNVCIPKSNPSGFRFLRMFT